MKVLFFSPAADIWEHAFPEALVAESLLKSGAETAVVRCNGILRPLCPAAFGAGIDYRSASAQKQMDVVCTRCQSKAALIDRKLGLKRILLDEYITQPDIDHIDDWILQVQQYRATASCEEAIDFAEFNGFPVGRIALYELILKNKKNDLLFSDDEWDEFLIALRGTAIVAISAQRLLKDYKPDSVSVYNSLYALHSMFCEVAKALGISQYFMHAGTNLSRQHGTLMIGQGFTWRYLKGLVDRFEGLRDQPATARLMADVSDHFLELLSAKNVFVYSSARSKTKMNVREHFGIREDQKLLIASTSSYDERFAVESVRAFPPAEDLLFKRQFDWIKALIEVATSRPDWFLLIRVHPREFPNRRDSIKSSHVQQMQLMLQTLPDNVKVNWPDETVSLYDLAQEADVFLNAWSSVGKEMALLGIPVVIYSPELVLYPTSLNQLGTRYDEYFSQIEIALAAGWDIERSRQAYRWYALEFGRSLVDMRNSYAPRDPSLLRRIFLRIGRKLSPLIQEHIDVWSRASAPRSIKEINAVFGRQAEMVYDVIDQSEFAGVSLDDESKALVTELKRIGKVLFIQSPSGTKSRLEKNFYDANILS
ncbi:Capsule polysaccharide biosynthesis protein [compost metagenome]